LDDTGEENLNYAYRQYNIAYGTTPKAAGNALLYSTAPVMGPMVFTGNLTKEYDGTTAGKIAVLRAEQELV